MVSETEEFEFRRRAEQEAAARRSERTLFGALAEGASNVLPHLWKGVTEDLPAAAVGVADLVTKPEARAAAAKAGAEKFDRMADTVGGYAQQVRNLSPPALRGSAPTMDTAPARQMEREVIQKYGVDVSPQRLAMALEGNLGTPNANAYRTFKDAIAEKPLTTALAVAPMVGPAARTAKVGAEIVRPAATAAGAKTAEILAAAPRGAARIMDAGATPASEAVRNAALAKVLQQQQVLKEAEAAAAAGKAADKPLRETMEAAAAAQAAKGIGVSDMPEAQALVADLKGRLNPTGDVITVPTADQAKAYALIINTLSPTAQGQKPSLETIINMRRQLADTAYGGADPSGFGAIGKLERRELVKALHKIEDAYTGGKSAPVRENWAAALSAQEKADELTKLGPTLTAQAALLDELPAQTAAARASAIVGSLAKKGLLTEEEYREFLQLANAATDARGKSAFRKRVALFAAAGLGASAGGAALTGQATGILP